MQKVVVIGKVEDMKKWEDNFRTHGELFKAQSVASPIEFAAAEGGDEVAAMFQVEDADSYLEALKSPATAAAMEQDGFTRDSIKVFVLNKEFAF